MAPRLLKALPLQTGIYGTLITITVLLPVIAVVRDPLTLGVIYGAMFIPYPMWSAGLSAYRASRIPDELQGRVQSVPSRLECSASACPCSISAEQRRRSSCSPSWSLRPAMQSRRRTSATVRRPSRRTCN